MLGLVIFGCVFAYLIAFAIQISILRKHDTYGSLDLLYSISLLVILTSGSAYLGFNTILVIFLTIILFFVLQLFSATKINKIKPSSDMSFFYFTFLTLYVLFGATSNFIQKLYVNPDPYGYATVIGATDRYGSFPNLIREFKNMTGSDFSFNIDWNDPSQVANKIAPWNTPDASLKYGIGNGMYLHNGLSYLLRPLVNLGKINETFVIGWKFFTIFSSALLLSLIFKLVISFINSRNVKDSLILSSKSKTFYISQVLIGVFLLIFSLNSRWFTVFILEGFGNQFLSYALCLGILVALLELNENKFKSKSSFILLAESLFLAIALFFVYAQQLPFQFLCLVIGFVCFKRFDITSARKKLFFTIPTFGLISYLLLKIPIVSTALATLNSSGGGGATHLGVLPLYKASGLLPDLNFLLSASQDSFGKYIPTQKLWPNSGYSGTGWMLVGQGYDIYIRPLFLVWCEIIFFALLIIIANILIKNRIFLGISIMSFLLLILQSYYLYTHTGNYILKNPDNSFNDYVWVRLLAFFSIFIWIQLLLVVHVFYSKYFKTFGNRLKIICSATIIIVFSIWSITNTYQISNTVNSYSQDTKIFEKCPGWLKPNEPNYFLTNNIFPELLITLCPVDIRFISDQFTALHKADNKSHDVTQIVYFPSTKKWEIKRIGKLFLNKDLQSPCDFNCLIKSEMFTKTN